MTDIVKRPWIALLGLLLLGLAACDAGGMGTEESDAIRQDLQTVQERLDEIDEQIAQLESGEADQEQIATAVREALEEARTSTQEAEEALPAEAEDPALDGGGDPLAPDGGAGDPLAPNDPAAPAF